MGTSTSYTAPPNWGPLKGEVTRVAKAGHFTRAELKSIVGGLIRENGGVSGFARGGGNAGRAGSSGPARAVARSLAGFIGAVADRGLAQALKELGLHDLEGRPLSEVLNALIDRLGGPGSSLDDVDAKAALIALRRELLGEATSLEEVEQILASQVAKLDELLFRYFSLYLLEHFSRVFFERLIRLVGESRALTMLDELGRFFQSALRNRTAGRDLTEIEWDKPEGEGVIMDIMELTLRVYGS